MEGISRIIGYKLKLEEYKSPQDILDDLVNAYNSLEFERAIEETFRKIEYYKARINETLKEYPELQEPVLKTYGYWGIINKENTKEGWIKI